MMLLDCYLASPCKDYQFVPKSYWLTMPKVAKASDAIMQNYARHSLGESLIPTTFK
ncbi:unnamed protein product [Rhodiola kirilowii]